MRRFFAYGLTIALLVACSTQEKDFQTPQQDDVVFYASFEQPTEEGTRVYANEDLLLRWTADDRVSIFNKLTYNQQYRFTGETGDNAGGFKKVDADEFVTGNTISHVVSVYPYQESTKITESEVLTVTLPAEQPYAKNTFGLGANTMVSVSSDNVLQYKNVGGYLMLKLYGEGVSVSSITLKGNNGEKLAGKASVTMPLDGVPAVTMASDATDVITLTCPGPVVLGATAEESTLFWFVVPPVSFSEGFTITVNISAGGIMEKSTTKSVTIERNNLSKMATMEVVTTSTNIVFADEKVKAKLVAAFDSNGDGELSFDEAGAVNSITELITALGAIKTYKSFDEFRYFTGVTSIPNSMFKEWNLLTSITIPESVSSIGNEAFYGCRSLSSIGLPSCLESIGEYSFYQCTSLNSIVIPESVASIKQYSFYQCESLSSITLPRTLTSIEKYSFYQCKSLSSLSIPKSVNIIGNDAFYGCVNLSSITLPENLTSVGYDCFADCSSLESIVIPENVSKIESRVFSGCSNLASVVIPESVTSIGEHAFDGCSSLTNVAIPESVTSINNGAFKGCSMLSSINIPEWVSIIGSEVFSNCYCLSGITIPNRVTKIGQQAFFGCKSLTSLTIPESVTVIEHGAFADCISLVSITIPDGAKMINGSYFCRCSSLTSFIIPKGMTAIPSDCFMDCSSLNGIIIPEWVTAIYSRAFYACGSLTSITIPKSVTSISNRAFWGCSGLSSITVLSETPPTGERAMFDDTNDCPIYVPATSLNTYKTAEYWRNYADRIQAIPLSSEAVDMDLPSGLKWASFNLGASSPEEYGDYYAWGETEPYYSSQDPLTWKEGNEAGYDWASYKWCMGDWNTITKYCSNSSYGYNGFTDTKTVLDLEDDAANVNLGSGWRMPTDAEWTELRDKCTWTWTTQNGVNGMLVTARNGNSIFLPAAGFRTNAGLYEVGSYGYYWSSSVNTGSSDCAWNAHFYSYSGSSVYIYFDCCRCGGFSVRPVCD